MSSEKNSFRYHFTIIFSLAEKQSVCHRESSTKADEEDIRATLNTNLRKPGYWYAHVFEYDFEFHFGEHVSFRKFSQDKRASGTSTSCYPEYKVYRARILRAIDLSVSGTGADIFLNRFMWVYITYTYTKIPRERFDPAGVADQANQRLQQYPNCAHSKLNSVMKINWRIGVDRNYRLVLPWRKHKRAMHFEWG